MYRSQDNSTKINDFENDENYEFKGATLKISSNETVYDNSSSIYNNNNDNGSSVNNRTVTSEKYTIGIDSNRKADHLQETSDNNSNSILAEKQKIGSPAHFFSFRSGQFERAIDDIVNILLRPTNDTNILGKWLLTEISHWDHERERVFILTTKTLLIVKYDFIALRILQHNKIRLTQIDTIIRGKLMYPETSLVPERNDIGIRIMWNRGQPISFLTSWNPFATDIPWITFKDHPLYSYQDNFNSPSIQENLEKCRQVYSADNLYDQLLKIFSNHNDDSIPNEVNYSCLFQNEPIIMQNYVGIGAVIHNKNNFGFFKVRGKFSF